VTRGELIRLVQRIRDLEDLEEWTPEERDRLIDLFEANVPHPMASSLVFAPELVTFEERELSAEEVVDLALSYERIRLGPASDIADPS
jgi:hypothetical protein